MRSPRLAFFWPFVFFSVVTLAVAEPRRMAWPSLQDQLAADRVVPGTALERLIAENQDFDLLRPEEAGDRLPVPAWLRVLWRKAHPEMVFDPADPTGGYPLLLKEIHEWMVSHPDLTPGEPEPDILPFLAFPGASGFAGVPIPNVRISGPAPNPRSESDIQVFEFDPRRIVAASNNLEGSGRQAQYWSTDGGLTWGQTELGLVEGDGFHSDPTVGWTSDGTAWSSAIGVEEGFGALRLRLYKSTDGGSTWTFDSTVSGDQDATDKQMVEIDTWPGSPFRDSIHAIWHQGSPVYVNRRRAGGSWGSPLQVSGAETRGVGLGADIETNAAGHVFGLWPDTGSRRIYMVKSTDGGESWSRPSVVAATFDSFDIGIPAMARRRALIYVAAGAWKAPGEDLVYAAWNDLSGARRCKAAGHEPRTSTKSSCKTRIWFARSTNGGATWSAKRMVHNPAGANDQFNPALVVDAATGHLALVYYRTGDGPAGRKRTDLWFQSSRDRGATWSAPVRVTTAQSDATASSADPSNQYGDYNGISGYAGTFFPVWTDRRTGQREEIWTAVVEEE
jgi:hypothetical protein